jgi:signal transduction histidine kinase
VSARLDSRRQAEVWIAWIRLAAVPFALVEVGAISTGFPEGYRTWAWVVTGVLSVGALAFMALARVELDVRARAAVGFAALAFDLAVVAGFIFIFMFEEGTPIRMLLFLPLVEAALRYGLRGGLALPVASIPILVLAEWFRVDRFGDGEIVSDHVTFPLGILLMTGAIVGWLVDRLGAETAVARAQTAEAESLRDQLGRRADQLEAVNRCARALSSTLDRDEAFRRFLREAHTAFRFDRLAIVLSHGNRAEIVANAGRGETDVLPAGSDLPLENTLLDEICRTGRTVYRQDMTQGPDYREERSLVGSGLRSRVSAPLVVAGRAIGILSISREEVDAFSGDEIDVVTLLGRQVGSAVENIRAFEAERSAAEELRRLSALRADFVSLVSHELRGPMASVIGCAATLRQRWRSLSATQRESFLSLIEEETSRLAGLVGDVLDTSRIEAGTFSLTLADVDLAELVRETAAVAAMTQSDVSVTTVVDGPIPVVRGDRDRLRQVLTNLLTNAVKYTVAGDEVELRAAARNGAVEVVVSDHGPGISPEDQTLIFEKFGRAAPTAPAKPGAGLGLFIARSIAEAHGGSLDVSSETGAGATFALRLPYTAT